MPYTGAYLIGSQTLRLFKLETSVATSQWYDTKENPTTWTIETLQERLNNVFRRITKKLKCLVLVNATQLSVELVRAAYDVAQQYADEVMVISATMARLQWAIETAKINYLHIDDKAVIVNFLNDIYEIDELVVTSNVSFSLISAKKSSRDSVKKMLLNIVNAIRPKSVIFLSTKEDPAFQEWFEQRYVNGNTHYIFDKPDFILLNGGLAKTKTLYCVDPTPMDITDFASGYKIVYKQYNETHIDTLIPFNSTLPVKNVIELAKIDSFKIVANEEITVAPVIPPVFAYARLQSNTIYENSKVKGARITASVNKSGHPYLKVDLQQFHDPVGAELSKMAISSKIFNKDAIKFIIKLKANTGSIWSMGPDGKEHPIINVNKNEWTPFYISFVRPEVKIGERAEKDSKKCPRNVLYDVHKVIGVPLKKIQADPEWEFKILPDEDKNFGKFGVENHLGENVVVPPESMMALFMKALKKTAENQFEVAIKEATVHFSSADYKPDQLKSVQEAAKMAGIVITNSTYMGF